MRLFKAGKHDYKAVAGDETELKGASDVGGREQQRPVREERANIFRTVVVLFITLLLAAGVLAIIVQRFDVLVPSNHPGDAKTPSYVDDSAPLAAHPIEQLRRQKRREWRTLTNNDKHNYISAVLCLLDQPSTLAPESNYTAYDDWPWVHSHVGYSTHHTASFLPWHRYFLHIYETTLKQKCGYEDGLVYWDWTLDSAAIENSPVFDPDTGFGGDGEKGGEITVSNTGRCVVDGPFAGVLAHYYDVKYLPHCLSRGFRDLDGGLGHIDGSDITPESIEEVLSSDNYEEFVFLMESRVHDAIPYGISGDFETFTAPYDPLFFLHHTQLDRLWWLWQERQPGSGLTAYSGHKQWHSVEMATLEDTIQMQSLAEPVRVAEVMDIHGELLCYDY